MQLSTTNLFSSFCFDEATQTQHHSNNNFGMSPGKQGRCTSTNHYVFSEPAFTSHALRAKWSGHNNYFTQHPGSQQPGCSTNFRHCLSDTNFSDMSTGSATTSWSGDDVKFENETYSININDTGEVKIHNRQTNEHYRIWGDPHVDVDGKRAFDFKGDTTFVLDDGTKVTIETTPWRGNNGQTISSKVSIIDGKSDYAVYVTGVDDHHQGDLAFEEVPAFGRFLDAMIADGNYVHENPDGQGFIAVGKDGWAEVDQSVMDFIEARASQLSDLLNNNSAAPSLESPSGTPANLFSLAQLQSYLSGQTAGTYNQELQDNLLSTLDSLLSLVKAQSRQFAHFSGMQQIETHGQFNFTPFSFTLNYSRA